MLRDTLVAARIISLCVGPTQGHSPAQRLPLRRAQLLPVSCRATNNAKSDNCRSAIDGNTTTSFLMGWAGDGACARLRVTIRLPAVKLAATVYEQSAPRCTRLSHKRKHFSTHARQHALTHARTHKRSLYDLDNRLVIVTPLIRVVWKGAAL